MPPYELLYHPGIPGRAEPIRLLLAALRLPYTDTSNSIPNGYTRVQTLCMNPTATTSLPTNPPVFAPPALRIPAEKRGSSEGDSDLLISQTPNILLYLGEKEGLGGVGDAKYHVHALALTALDLANETHDSHHPIGVGLTYEQQATEAGRRAQDFRAERLPKFLGFFERVLKGNGEGGGKFLCGAGLTYADLVVWWVVDGLWFAFPREMGARKRGGEFGGVLGGFYEGIKGEAGVREYLASEERLPYGMGLFRQYPELDREE